jgi:preprotein translocase subunit YajC
MNGLLANLYLLADELTKPATKVAEEVAPEGNGFPMLPAFIAMGLVFLFMFRGPKKEKQKRDSMLKSLKKNDKVVTHSGVIGTIANISNDLREITLKVDDSTRIKFVANVIAGKYQEADEKAKDTKDTKDEKKDS